MNALHDIQVRLTTSNQTAAWNLPPDLSVPSKMLLCDSQTGAATLIDADGTRQLWDNPLSALDWMAQDILQENQPPSARWIGYLSYDLGRRFEHLPGFSIDDPRLPLFVFTYHAPFASYGLDRQSSVLSPQSFPPPSNFTRRDYESAIGRVIEYIRAGDVFQVNLSQRFTAELNEKPSLIYARLPAAAYGAYLDYSDFALLCNSPELFFRVASDRRITTRPVKGTRPRLPGMREQLESSLKDTAELNMIVDLERNDLGKVCEIGSVKVTQPRVIEDHPTVYHGVATIEGQLRNDVSFVDLLRAIFPGGSVTGAPKIRAMQIIDELEPVRRGPYCGAIGYLAADGCMEFNVAIRTMIAKDGRVHIPVGGGIVADSDPAAEYEETLVKAQAMFAALRIQRPRE
jgi:anthranilate/para-aminobenzoate synthase component I